jgi:hypothetical protein|tara:strand:+ start:7342 stop:7518 length:177 start_codon:yes stop_codon:yes gene_type:complete
MKTIIFILVIMEGTEVVDEVEIGSYQNCSWNMEQINRANTGRDYSAFCRPWIRGRDEK